MKNYSAVNKKWWNDVTPIHANSALYDLTTFKNGKSSLQALETKEVGNVKGKKLLHLLCHFGMDTLSFARSGAIVTGVDLSDTSIALAKKISREINVPATFICADVYDLQKILDEKFDIIFASYGALCWLANLDKWFALINLYLKKGGVFYIVDRHPFTNMLSHEFKISYKYFSKDPYIDESPGTYADWNADITGKTYMWDHTISDIINAAITEGLTIEYVHEFPYTMYNQYPKLMKKNKKGQYVLKNTDLQIPLLFSLKATK